MLHNPHATQNQNNNVINHPAPSLQLMPGAPSQHLTRPRAIVKSTAGDTIGALVNARRDPTSFVYSGAQDDNDASLTFKTMSHSTQGLCPVHTRALVRREMKTSPPPSRPLALCPVSDKESLLKSLSRAFTFVARRRKGHSPSKASRAGIGIRSICRRA